jgi:hypothetical protein
MTQKTTQQVNQRLNRKPPRPLARPTVRRSTPSSSRGFGLCLLVSLASTVALGASELRLLAGSQTAGGGASSGADLSLTGAIGQAATGSWRGGAFHLEGGLWAAAAPSGQLFADGFESGNTGSWSHHVGGN